MAFWIMEFLSKRPQQVLITFCPTGMCTVPSAVLYTVFISELQYNDYNFSFITFADDMFSFIPEGCKQLLLF